MSQFDDKYGEEDYFGLSDPIDEQTNNDTPQTEIDPWSIDALNLPNGDNDNDLYSTTGSYDTDADKDGSYEDDEGPSKEKKPKNKKKKSSKSSKAGRIVLSVVLVFIITVCLVFGSFAVYVFAFVDDSIPYDLDSLQLQYTTVIYAKDKKTDEYYQLTSMHGTQNRIWVDLDDCSPYLADAIVALEDKRFYDHDGVDWKRTFSAFANMFFDLYGGVQGGSTITQQLVKNLTGDDQQTSMRKIQEIVRARRLERDYAKTTIIECYINTVHFGNGCDGIQTAAQFYFGKKAKDLTLGECAALAATIQTPSVINPLDDPQGCEERRILCLNEMLEQELITQQEHDAAVAEKVKAVDHNTKTTEESAQTQKVSTYFEDALTEQVINDLMEQKGMTEEEATDKLVSGGLRIYSTFDKDIQASLDDTYSLDRLFPANGDERPQSASVIMDYQGHVVAMVGGRGEKKASLGFNRATQAYRQAGSSIKPLAGYSPALEANLITYSSLIEDARLSLPNGGYYPSEYGSGGQVSVKYALANSLNCPAVRVVDKLGVNKSFEFLTTKYHLTTLVDSKTLEDGSVVSDKNYAALGLGGMLYGVHIDEMTAAYAAFGNLGVYWKPTLYTIIYDNFGNVVLEQEERGQQVIGSDTANIMNELLQRVTAEGTATSASFGSWPIFGKTGTTDDKHDSWFIGGTPYYVSAVWMGYDESRDLPEGVNATLHVWRATMNEIHEDLELCDFRETDEVLYLPYCYTGDIASTYCGQNGYGFFKKSYLNVCDHGSTCASEGTKPSPAGGKFVAVPDNKKPAANDAIYSIKKQQKESDSSK